MAITIRKLTPELVPEILRVWHAAELAIKPGGRDRPDNLAREVERYPDNFIGAFDGDRLVGLVLASWDGRKGWINRLAVVPDYRRRGIAGQLIGAAEAELERRGAMIIAALIEDYNEPSLECFARAGYETYQGVVYVTKRKGSDV